MDKIPKVEQVPVASEATADLPGALAEASSGGSRAAHGEYTKD